jgi:hypothetical protein
VTGSIFLGRRPKYGSVAQTDAARQQRSRANRKGVAPTIDAATVQQCFRDAIGKSGLPVPEIENCELMAEAFSFLVRELALCPPEGGRPWWFLAVYLHRIATRWRAWGEAARSLKEDAPICVFVQSVMKYFGFIQTRSAISAVLRGRRGRGAYWK